jgi:hypothetical protein
MADSLTYLFGIDLFVVRVGGMVAVIDAGAATKKRDR